jgi:hypothetical protein
MIDPDRKAMTVLLNDHFHCYEMTAEEIAKYRCMDCNFNVVKVGDFTMLKRTLWEGQLGLTWDDNHLTCIERRLGRELTVHDLCALPHVEGYEASPKLNARLAPAMAKVVTRPSRAKVRRTK